MLSAKVVATKGGETEFASTYAAYDDLGDDEKERFEAVRVLHSFEASQRLVHPTRRPRSWRVGARSPTASTRWSGATVRGAARS